jgi:hypothetical protein
MHRLEGSWKTPGTSSNKLPFKRLVELCIHLGMMHVVLYEFRFVVQQLYLVFGVVEIIVH